MTRNKHENKRQKPQSFFRNTFRDATIHQVILLVILLPFLESCSSNSSTTSEVKTSESTMLTQSNSMILEEQASSTSPIKQSSTSSTISQALNKFTTTTSTSPVSPTQPPIAPQTTKPTSPPTPTTLPRFIPFSCAIKVSDTTHQMANNSRVIRIDVSISRKDIPVVAVEAVTESTRKKLLLELSKTGEGYTQIVVPDTALTTISVFASPDFYSDAEMCSGRG